MPRLYMARYQGVGALNQVGSRIKASTSQMLFSEESKITRHVYQRCSRCRHIVGISLGHLLIKICWDWDFN